MSGSTTSYEAIKSLTESRFGADFSTAEESRFAYILNDEARALYDRSDFWPRWLTLEPRTVKRGYIADEEDGFHVYGAETKEANGLYSPDGNDFVLANGYKITLDTFWKILDSNGSEVYTTSESGDVPPLDGWTGDDIGPLVQPLGKIDRILWQFDGEKWSNNNSNLLKNYRDKNGIRSTNGNGVVWVAYKAKIDDYGNGTGGTNSEIPKEFSRYIALAAAYTMSRANKQSNSDATYAPAYAQVEAAAQDALIGITREGAWNTIMNFKETYYSYDNSIR